MTKTGRILTTLAVLLCLVSRFIYAKIRAAALNQALCLAASQEDTDAVTRLLKRGASPNAVGVVPSPNQNCDILPQRALSLAVSSPSTRGLRGIGPMYAQIYDAALPTTALLIQAGADVNARDQDISTALMEARSVRMVKFLLAHGAKVDLKSDTGVTALMVHADYFSVGEMGALPAAGADANARDSQGRTALMWALQQSTDPDMDPDYGPGQVSKVTLKVVKRLIAAGAEVNAQDDQGKAALWYARDNTQTDSIRFLKKIKARQEKCGG